MLCIIDDKVGHATDMSCFNKKLYYPREDKIEPLYECKFDYNDMFEAKQINEEWRMFFVYVLGYRIEYAYDPANSRYLEETMHQIMRVLTAADLIHVLARLKINAEALKNERCPKMVSYELM